MEPPDLLIEVLRLARQEGALEGNGLEAFATALRERAERIVEERLSRAEARVQELEREVAWRRESVAALQQENEWRRQTMAALESQATALRGDLERTLQETRRLREEMDRLREDREAASRAHDQLLAHHRDVLGRTVAELRRLAALPVYRWPSLRRRLRALAGSLGRDGE